jgi:hypothetical protein
MTLQAQIKTPASGRGQGLTPVRTALIMLVLFLGTALVYWAQGFEVAAVFLMLGLGYGFVFYKAHLCFASAFYGNRPDILRGILIGLMAASIGSAVVIGLGLNRVSVIPFGLHTFFGAMLFGFALPFAGGCMTGTCFRFGGGQAKSLFALLGILIGNGLGAAFVWPFTEPLMMRWGIRVYLPDVIGLLPATLLNLAIMVILYRRLRHRVTARARPSLRVLFARGAWPAWLGGLLIAVLFVIQFAYQSALTVQLPLARFVLWLSSLFGAPVQNLAWSNFFGLRLPGQDPTFLLDVGLIAGAMMAALTMNEFAGYRDLDRKQALVGLLAGIVMGIAVWIAIGCNVSGFFSTVATLRFEGWIYALGMFIGVRAGLRAVSALVMREVL